MKGLCNTLKLAIFSLYAIYVLRLINILEYEIFFRDRKVAEIFWLHFYREAMVQPHPCTLGPWNVLNLLTVQLQRFRSVERESTRPCCPGESPTHHISAWWDPSGAIYPDCIIIHFYDIETVDDALFFPTCRLSGPRPADREMISA
jgi:hypothetical protein